MVGWWFSQKRKSRSGISLLVSWTSPVYHRSNTFFSQSSCIDPIFIDQPTLIIDRSVPSSLRINCKHQINHCKLNLNIVLPPSYKHLAWNYKRAGVTEIRKGLDLLNKTINDQVLAFDQFLMSIFTNYVPTLMIKMPHGWMTT